MAVAKKPTKLHGYTLRFHGYGMWRIEAPNGVVLPDYYRTREQAVDAIKRRTGRRPLNRP